MKIIFLFCLLFCFYVAHSQELEWVKLAKTSSIFDLSADHQNQIYLSGNSNTSANFGKEIQYNGSYIAKLNSTGNLLWFKPYPHSCRYLVDNQGMGYILSTGFRRLSWAGKSVETRFNALFVVRANEQGEPLWMKALESPNGLKNFKTALKGKNVTIQFRLESALMYEGQEVLAEPSHPLSVRIEIGEYGQITSIQSFEADKEVLSDVSTNDYFYDSKGYMYVMGKDNNPLIHSTTFNPLGLDYLTKISQDGRVLWSSTLADKAEKGGFQMTGWAENTLGFVVGGKFLDEIQINGQKFGSKGTISAFVGQFDEDGNMIWFKYGSSELNLFTSNVATSRNRIFAAGSINGFATFEKNRVVPMGMDYFLWNIPVDDAAAVWVMGNIKSLNQKDCELAGHGLEGFRVQAQPNGLFASTDRSGNYKIRLSEGTHTLKQAIPQRFKALYAPYCPFESQIQLELKAKNPPVNNINFRNLGRKTHFLRVNLSSDRRRRCFRNQTRVYYENSGNQAVEGVEIVVTLDKYIVPIQSLPSWNIKNGNQLRYQIGRLEAGGRGIIHITDSVICGMEEIRGMVQCSRAEILPLNPLGFSDEDLWDGSDLNISGFCVNNRITALSITNIGQGNMSDSTAYRLFVDDRLAIAKKIKLTAGDSQAISVDAASATVRLEADNTPYNPNRRRVARTVLPCLEFEFRPQSTENQIFNQDDENARISEECLTILDSYDPNDKLAQPRGWSEQNCVLNNEILNYKIRFQNTGSDTAYKVVLIDTLSPHFDLESFEIGTASHRFDWQLLGDNQHSLLVCTFENIMLPDSLKDPVGSQGFVDFSVRLKPNLPPATQITNSADIYFDFNSPIQTNTTLHTVCELPLPDPQLKTKVKQGHVFDSQINILCYPNPVQNELTLRLTQSGWDTFNNLEVLFWDLTGRHINTYLIEPNENQVFETKISLSDLSAGIYIVELRSNGSIKSHTKVLKAN